MTPTILYNEMKDNAFKAIETNCHYHVVTAVNIQKLLGKVDILPSTKQGKLRN